MYVDDDKEGAFMVCSDFWKLGTGSVSLQAGDSHLNEIILALQSTERLF